MAIVQKKKPGPKSAFRTKFEKDAHKLALLGATEKQMADFFGVKIGTFEVWKRNKPEFENAIREGRVVADANVAKSFYRRALGYSHPDTVILTNRVTEYNDDGKPVKSYIEPLIVPTIKHYPPDSYACNKWLSLRQKEQWADVQKIDHLHTIQGSVGVHHIVEQIGNPENLSMEELKLALKLGVQRASLEQKRENN